MLARIRASVGSRPVRSRSSIRSWSGYDRAVETGTMRAFEIARGLRVQRFGRKGPHEILDALVEPLWDGPRVIVAVERGEAAVFHEGTRLNGPPDIVAQLAS